jgi:hypothetical protein
MARRFIAEVGCKRDALRLRLVGSRLQNDAAMQHAATLIIDGYPRATR